MSEKQLRGCKKLIRKRCCNYKHGNCLRLDDGKARPCPQIRSNILKCMWFVNAVLPTDVELEADIMKGRLERMCCICGKPITSTSNHAKYCAACAVQERRKKDETCVIDRIGSANDGNSAFGVLE